MNDELLPPVDIADAELDVTNFIVPGENTIRVEVSSTLFNAVKARWGSLFTAGMPVMFEEAYKDAPEQKYGLIGPVSLRVLRKVVVDV